MEMSALSWLNPLKKNNTPIRLVNIRFPLIAFTLIVLASCGKGGGGDDNDDNVNSACGFTPDKSIAAEFERLDGQLQSLTEQSEELLLRKQQIGQLYDIGQFLQDGNFQRSVDVSGSTLPFQDLTDIRFDSSFNSEAGSSVQRDAFGAYAGFSVGYRFADFNGRKVAFESTLAVSNLRLRQLSNTQEIIDANKQLAPNSNQFVYGVYEGEVVITVALAAQCGQMSEQDIEAAIDIFSASQTMIASKSQSISGGIDIRSNGRIPIAYLVRAIDETISTPINLNAGIEEGPVIAINWDAVPAISNYRVYYSQNAGFNRDTPNIFSSDVTAAEFELRQGVELGETWHFRAAAVSGGTVGNLSTPLAVTVPVTQPDTALTIDAFAQANGSIKLVWGRPANNDANNYIVMRKESASANWISLANIAQSNPLQNENFQDREYIDTSVQEGTSYDYQMTYENFLSPPSAPLSNIVSVVAPSPVQASRPPEAIVDDVPSVNELQVVRLVGSDSFDPDNDPLSYSWEAVVSNPVSITLQDANSPVATFVAPAIDTPFITVEFELTVSDGVLSDREIVAVTIFNNVLIDPENTLPVVSLSASQTSVLEGDEVTLDASESSDADGDDLSFIWRQISHLELDTGVDGQTGPTATFNAPFEVDDSITLRFLVEVSDGTSTKTGDIAIVVNKRGESRNGLVTAIESLNGSLESEETGYWSFTVTNTSDFVREAVELEAFFPDQVQSVHNNNIEGGGSCSSPGSTVQCDTPNESIRWTIGDLAPGEGRRVGMPAQAQTTLDTQTPVVINAIASDSLGSSAVDSLEINLLDDKHLELRLTTDKNPLITDEDIVYTLTYGFTQPSSQAVNAQLIFDFPVSMTFRSASHSGVLTTADQSGRVTWSLGNLQQGETGTVSVRLRANNDLFSGELIRTSAQIVDDSAQPTPTHANNIVQIIESRPLDIALVSSHNPVANNMPVELYLTVSNNSAQDRENINVAFRLEEDGFNNLSEIQISQNGQCVGSSCERNEWINWSIDQIGAGKSLTFSLSPTVVSAIEEGNAINLLTTYNFNGQQFLQRWQTLEVNNEQQLELALSANESPVTPLQTLRYTLAYLFNQPSAQAEDVELSLQLPDGVVFVQASGGGTFDGSAVNWSLGTLEPGETSGERTVDVTVSSALAAGSQLIAQAAVKDNTSRHAYQSVSVPVAQSKPLDIKISAGNSPVNLNDIQPVQITISNNSSFRRNNVAVQLHYQQEWQSLSGFFISDNGACSGSSCNFAGEFLQWNLPQLESDESKTLSFNPRLNSTVANNIVQIRASVSDASQEQAWANEALLISPLRGAELKVDADKNPVKLGESITLSLHYGVKDSASALSSGLLSMEVPAGLTIVFASDGGTVNGQDVSWTLGSLSPGDSGVVTLLVRVDNNNSQLPGTLLSFNATLVDSNTALSNGTFTSTKMHLPVAQDRPVELDVQFSTATVAPNSSTQIDLTVTNTSTFSRSNIVVNMRYPAEFAALSDTLITGGECPSFACDAGEWVTWTIASLGEGESTTLSLTPTVRPDVPIGTVISIASDVNNAHQHASIRVTEP